MAGYDIRIIGDPVLRQKARPVTDIDGALVRLVDDMFEVMYEAPGIGLAAPQVGVQKQLFVWDVGTGPLVIVNPELVESDGEWLFEEGCLSVPGLSWEIMRPKTIHVVGRDLGGNEISVEADELESRLLQHELDHLAGILLIERLDDDTRNAALKTIRDMQMGLTPDTGQAGPAAPTVSAAFAAVLFLAVAIGVLLELRIGIPGNSLKNSFAAPQHMAVYSPLHAPGSTYFCAAQYQSIINNQLINKSSINARKGERGNVANAK